MGYLRVKTPRTFMPGDVIMGRLNMPKREVPLTVLEAPRVVNGMSRVGVKVRESGAQLVWVVVDLHYMVESER